MKRIPSIALIATSVAALGLSDRAIAPAPSIAVEPGATAAIPAAPAPQIFHGPLTNGQQSVITVLPSQPLASSASRTARMQETRPLQLMDDALPCVRPGSGLLGWWQGEGDANDSAGTNNGQFTYGGTFAAGMVGAAFSFDGSSQSVQIPYATSLGSPSFTIEAWVNPSGQPSGQTALICGQYGGRCLITRPGDSGLWVGVVVTDLDGTPYELDSGDQIEIGVWTHLAATWDGAYLTLYVSGAQSAQDTPWLSGTGDSGCPFSTGGMNDSCGYSGDYFPGLIDEVSLYDRALFAGEVNAICLAGAAGKCKSAPACIACPESAVSWWAAEGDATDSFGANGGALQNGAGFAPGIVGQAFSFDGASQAVQIPYSANLVSSTFSVEAWVNPANQPDGQAFIFGQGFGRQLDVEPGNQGLGVAFFICSSAWNWYGVYSSAEIPIGEWTHLVGTWDGTLLNLYVNGSLDQQATLGIVPQDSGCSFTTGGVSDSCGYYGQYFPGLIDEVTLYGSALQSDQIQAIYNAGSAGKCSALDAWLQVLFRRRLPDQPRRSPHRRSRPRWPHQLSGVHPGDQSGPGCGPRRERNHQPPRLHAAAVERAVKSSHPCVDPPGQG